MHRPTTVKRGTKTSVKATRGRYVRLWRKGLLYPIVFTMLSIGIVLPHVVHACEPGPECARPSDYAIAHLDAAGNFVELFKVSDAGPHELYFEAPSSTALTIKLRAVALDDQDEAWGSSDYGSDYQSCVIDGAVWSSTNRSDSYGTNNHIAEYTFPTAAGKYTITGQHQGWTCYGEGDCVGAGESCTLAGMSSALTLDVYQIRAEVLSASIVNNQVQVRLTPAGLTGSYVLAWEGDGGPYCDIITTPSKVSGTYNESAGIPLLTAGVYHEAVVYWTVGNVVATDERSYNMRVLGDHTHTRYSLVTPANCDGPTTGFCSCQGNTAAQPCDDITVPACAEAGWTTNRTAPKQWLSELYENGSGYHSTIGNYFIPERWCASNAPDLAQCTATWTYGTAPDEVTVRTKLRDVGSAQHGCPYCTGVYKYLTANATVAIRSAGHQYLQCGDRVFVEDVGVVTVTDTGALDSTQLDHYAGTYGCGQTPGSIGTKNTIMLFFE